MREILRLSLFTLCMSIVFTLSAPNFKTTADEPAGGYWDGCGDGSSSPGNKSGCWASFSGTGQDARGCVGFYTYHCGGNIVTCAYVYENSLPCGGGDLQ